MAREMEKRRVAFVHTSPAAVGPVAQFYKEAAPEFEVTNLLDDGLLRLLAGGRVAAVERRLADMIGAAAETYGAEAAMVTCSSVPLESVEKLAASAGLPVLKIDYPMARRAVRAGRLIGVAATFPPTLGPTGRLLAEAARDAGTEIEIIEDVTPEAYEALLSGDAERHDRLLLEGIARLEAKGVSVVVLAQVSMARVLPAAEGRFRVPLLTSLHTSLEALRAALA
jgi:Asp/Glu/hydantoin racemase